MSQHVAVVLRKRNFTLHGNAKLLLNEAYIHTVMMALKQQIWPRFLGSQSRNGERTLGKEYNLDTPEADICVG